MSLKSFKTKSESGAGPSAPVKEDIPDEVGIMSDDDSESNFGSASEASQSVPLNFLSHMITPFNGDSKELNNFLQNANNAIGLASASQKYALELYIFSKVSSDVKTKINMSNISSYTQLRDKLIAVYSPVESYDYLMEQLETTKQKSGESVREFYIRLDKITSKCLVATEKEATAFVLKSDKKDKSHVLESEKRVILRVALRRFTHHAIPELSQILRHRQFSNINEAFSLACEEEAYLINEGKLKRQNSQSNSTNYSTNTKYCKNCKSKSHNTRDCRFNQQNRPNNNYNNSNFQNMGFKYCNYCRIRGHSEIECKKKRYSNNLNPNPRIAHAQQNEHRNYCREYYSGPSTSRTQNNRFVQRETNEQNHLNYNQSLVETVSPADIEKMTERVSSYSLE